MKRPLIPVVAALALSLSLSACAVGPNYVKPASTPARDGTFVDPAAARADAVTPAPVPAGTWWRLFDDPVLDRLIADALAHNADVREAAANVRKARALLSEAKTDRLPTTNLSGGYTRNRIGLGAAVAQGAIGGTTPAPGGPSHIDYDFYQTGIDASYEVDLFGRVSRSVEAARGEWVATEADLDAARIAVAAETARTYATACASAEQAHVARETAELQGRTLDLTRRLYDGGRGTQRDIDQANVLAQQALAQVPTFEADRRAALYALAALTGRPPREFDQQAAQCTVTPRVTTAIPIGDGAALLARRPDVRAAERRLAAQTARIGVATAALFPKITLGGNATLGAQRPGDLGKASSFGFSLGPLISWSFPNISVARSRIRQERAETEAALARFDGTVLTALTEAESALARYSGALDSDAALTSAAASAENAARLSRVRFDAGRDSFLQLLDAERARASSRAALAEARAALTEAQVGLFAALGGGWEEAAQAEKAK
ncbi:TolC family protein [Sphingomonas naphthae]|uniref:TolC family protein n=1 Tax=Sphingomonas naphthae TaxID=1813468 RepID=A0ABY7TNE8_9SPHN|nr:TolC family protein [Sphingomonas naphthae]WCT74762.1 TolC family protein [Sphingomonas naphthae]